MLYRIVQTLNNAGKLCPVGIRDGTDSALAGHVSALQQYFLKGTLQVVFLRTGLMEEAKL